MIAVASWLRRGIIKARRFTEWVTDGVEGASGKGRLIEAVMKELVWMFRETAPNPIETVQPHYLSLQVRPGIKVGGHVLDPSLSGIAMHA